VKHHISIKILNEVSCDQITYFNIDFGLFCLCK